MTKQFVSEPLTATDAAGDAHEPKLPAAFRWRDETLEVKFLIKTWRSTKEDRGDVYLKRHWFEFASVDGRIATVYFDRASKRGAPRWWLYAIEAG